MQPAISHHSPTKGPVSIATLIQLLTIFPMFVEVSFVLTRDNDFFTHSVTRSTVLVCWWVLLVWLVTICTNVYAILNNSYMMLLPNIIFCIWMLIPSYGIMVVLVSTRDKSFSCIVAAVVCCMITGCIYQESITFVTMKKYLK